MSKRVATALAFSLMLCHGFASAEQSAQERADALFEQGVERFRVADFAGALERFRGSYAASPTPALHYNIGACHYNLEQWAEARRELSAYLAETDPSLVTAERRQRVEGLLAEIDERIGPPPPVQDPAPDPAPTAEPQAPEPVPAAQGPAPEPPSVMPPPRPEGPALPASGSGDRGVRSPTQQPPASNLQHSAASDQPPATSHQPPATSLQSEPRRVSPAWFWLAASLAVALAVGGGVTGGLVLGAESDFDALVEECSSGTRQGCYEEGVDLRDRADALAAATNALFGTAGAFAVAALVLAFFTEWGGRQEAGEWRLGVGANPSGLALDVSLRF